MKRFTETTKWDDPWFRRLKPRFKCLWLFLCDKCDCAGVWVVDLDLAATFIGEKIDGKAALTALDGRVVDIGGGKWLVPGFIPFQYGELSKDCKPHKPVFAAVARHGLVVNCKGYSKGIERVPDRVQEKDKDKEMEEDKEKDSLGDGLLLSVSVTPPQDPSAELKGNAVLILTHLNQKAGRHFDVTKDVNLSPVMRVLCEGFEIAEIMKMIDRQVEVWKGTNMEEYLQPSTLFAKGNFQKYYDKRNLPIFKDQPAGKSKTTETIPLKFLKP